MEEEAATVQFNIRFPPALLDEIEKWVKAGYYTSKAEFVKDAVTKLTQLVDEKKFSQLNLEVNRPG